MRTQFILKPATNRLKQLIKQHGAHWFLLQGPKPVLFASGKWVLIESEDGTHMRWVVPENVQTIQADRRKP